MPHCASVPTIIEAGGSRVMPGLGVKCCVANMNYDARGLAHYSIKYSCSISASHNSSLHRLQHEDCISGTSSVLFDAC